MALADTLPVISGRGSGMGPGTPRIQPIVPVQGSNRFASMMAPTPIVNMTKTAAPASPAPASPAPASPAPASPAPASPATENMPTMAANVSTADDISRGQQDTTDMMRQAIYNATMEANARKDAQYARQGQETENGAAKGNLVSYDANGNMNIHPAATSPATTGMPAYGMADAQAALSKGLDLSSWSGLAISRANMANANHYIQGMQSLEQQQTLQTQKDAAERERLGVSETGAMARTGVTAGVGHEANVVAAGGQELHAQTAEKQIAEQIYAAELQAEQVRRQGMLVPGSAPNDPNDLALGYHPITSGVLEYTPEGGRKYTPLSGMVPAGGTAPPAPKDKASLQVGRVYQTARGPAKWNGSNWEAQ